MKNFNYEQEMTFAAYRTLNNEIAHNVVLSLYSRVWTGSKLIIFCDTEEQFECVSKWMELYN
jgi:hypothetical protein